MLQIKVVFNGLYIFMTVFIVRPVFLRIRIKFDYLHINKDRLQPKLNSPDPQYTLNTKFNRFVFTNFDLSVMCSFYVLRPQNAKKEEYPCG